MGQDSSALLVAGFRGRRYARGYAAPGISWRVLLAPNMRPVSEPPDLRELGRATGKMLADELAAYQDERRAEIVTTGEVPAELRANVEMRYQPGLIARDPTAFWEGFVEGMRATDVSRWQRE
jgi:hypothetical protein